MQPHQYLSGDTLMLYELSHGSDSVVLIVPQAILKWTSTTFPVQKGWLLKCYTPEKCKTYISCSQGYGQTAKVQLQGQVTKGRFQKGSATSPNDGCSIRVYDCFIGVFRFQDKKEPLSLMFR